MEVQIQNLNLESKLHYIGLTDLEHGACHQDVQKDLIREAGPKQILWGCTLSHVECNSRIFKQLNGLRIV